MSETAVYLAAVAVAGVILVAVLVRLRLRRPDLVSTARLADDKSGAQDHFLTLSTIDPKVCSPSLVRRLRRDTANFGDRIEFNVMPMGERLISPFPITPEVAVAPGNYDWTRYRLEGTFASKRSISAFV